MRACSRCGEESPHRARFCLRCGTPLEPVAAREERKVVSVLLADLVGFTGRSAVLDPEDVRALQDRYWGVLRTELERHGGTVEKFIGDAVVGLFGAPVAREDDPERAVRAALAIRDWACDQDALQVRIGVTTGEALVRLNADPLAGEGMASGDVVNTVSRLQAAAPANAVLVDETTYRATRHAIGYREAEPVVAKGKPGPLPVWEALEARARLGVDVAHRVRAPLIGRERELDVLRDAFARARHESTPQLVTLVGVPGIGKSRLVYELGRSLDAEPELVRWRQGRALPYGDGAAFWPLAEIVKAEAGILETDAEEEAAVKLARTARRTAGEEAGWVERHLRPLVGLSGAGGTGGDGRSEAFAAWRRFLESLAEERPSVFVFEDLHWADDGLLDFVGHLLEWAGRVPFLALCTARPELLERRSGWGGGTLNAAMLALSPLADDETEALLDGLLTRTARGDDEQAALLERVGGNPLYAEQFALLLGEQEPTEEPALPETVQGIIAARLDTLAPADKRLLQSAAVLGKVFWEGSVLAVGGVDGQAAAATLHGLERKEFVQRARRSSVAGEREYAFRHVLVRDVAYAQLPRSTRAELHERAAAWIESLGRPDDHAEMVAHHYVSALELREATGRDPGSVRERAAESLERAGERALAVSAFPLAARHYERALQLVPDEDLRRARLLFGYARALFGAGDEQRAGALEAARTALLASGDTERTAEAHVLLADVAWFQGSKAAADEHVERALALVRAGPPSPTKARVLAECARFRMLAEEPSAIALAREALALAEALDLPDTRANALITLGTARWLTGDPSGASDIERGLRLGLEHDALSAAQRGYTNLAMAAGRAGDRARRLQLLEEAEALARRLGNPHQIRYVKPQLTTMRFNDGEWDTAVREADEFIAECEAGSPHVQESSVREVRAWIRLARDDVDGALADLEIMLGLRAGPAQVRGCSTLLRPPSGSTRDSAGIRRRVRWRRRRSNTTPCWPGSTWQSRSRGIEKSCASVVTRSSRTSHTCRPSTDVSW